ncbi:MAG TPA: hypothetical protein VNN55_08985 [bacterium]|nr:hypothetical protein [bacterium]
MSELDVTVRKARLYDLHFEIERQTVRVREAAEAARGSACVWFEWKGSVLDLMNIGQGIGQVRKALDRLAAEHERLTRLLAERGETQQGV